MGAGVGMGMLEIGREREQFKLGSAEADKVAPPLNPAGAFHIPVSITSQGNSLLLVYYIKILSSNITVCPFLYLIIQLPSHFSYKTGDEQNGQSLLFIIQMTMVHVTVLTLRS
jgi:hypothetical protein